MSKNNKAKKDLIHKPKVLFIGLTQELITAIIDGMFKNAQIIAAISSDANLQGRIINYGDNLLFIVRPEEFPKIKFDFIVVNDNNAQVVNNLINQLIGMKVKPAMIKIFNQGNLFDVNVQQTKILPPRKVRPRFFFDVSRIAQQDFKTGIQRVIRNVYRNVDELTNHDIETMQYGPNGITTSRKFDSYVYDKEYDYTEYNVEFIRNDKILLMDTLWNIEQYKDLAAKIESNNLTVSHVIYDLVPIRYPEYHRAALKFFEPCLKMILQTQSAVICISKVTADDVIAYYKEQNIKRSTPLNIYYFHLSFEMESITGAGTEVRPLLKDFVNRGKTFLMVGTIEVRKNHITALRAFKKIVEQNPQEDAQLLIIGRLGWLVEEFVEMISNDSQLQSKVLWLQDASDFELHWAYQNSTALIAASFTEGFGLPLVEAAQFGLPIICSDIPIFREVTDGNAVYFQPQDDESLKKVLLDWDNLKQTADSSKIRLYTWKECSQEILDIVDGKAEPYQILN